MQGNNRLTCASVVLLLRFFVDFCMASSDSITGLTTWTEAESVKLSDSIVCSHDKLAEALAPLLKGRSAPFTFTVPTVARETGGWTKPFPFVVALRSVTHLLPPDASALFPDEFRKELHSMSAQQIVAYQTWSEAEKTAYALLYSRDEWKANVAVCRRVYQTTNKAANKVKKRGADSSVALLEASERCSTSGTVAVSGFTEPTALLSVDANHCANTKVRSTCIGGTMASCIVMSILSDEWLTVVVCRFPV
jgi:hypothetical protein